MVLGKMAHKYNFYFAIILEKEKLDHKGRQVALFIQFPVDNKTASTIFYLLKNPDTISL